MTRPAFLTLLLASVWIAALGTDVRADAPVPPSLRLSGSAAVGYDDNPSYDSTRAGDAFAREGVSLDLRHRASPFLLARASYGVLNVNYFEATDQNVLGQRVGAGLDWLVDRDTALETDYVFRHAYFADNSTVDFTDHQLRVGAARRLDRRTILRAGASAAFRGYLERDRLGADGRASDDRRGDLRYEADASLAGRFSRAAAWGAGVRYRLNDSNELFHDFHDYRQWEPYLALRFELDGSTSLELRGSYQRREYDSRPLLDDASAAQDDDTWSAQASLRREISRGLYLTASYLYRQRDSSEPFQEYSGSITTLGLQALF